MLKLSLSLFFIQIKPQSLYLEEELSKNAEFPEDGQFRLATYLGSRYKICGDPVEEEGPAVNEDVSQSSASSSSGLTAVSPFHDWSIRRPWSAGGSGQRGKLMSLPPPHSSKKFLPAYEPYYKRTIPFVTPALDHTERNVYAGTTVENVYIQVPESAVSVSTILQEAGKKVGIPAEELIILDSKWIPVSDCNGRIFVMSMYS